jgi:hypothetical protein
MKTEKEKMLDGELYDPCGKKALFFQPPCFHIVKPPGLFRSI